MVPALALSLEANGLALFGTCGDASRDGIDVGGDGKGGTAGICRVGAFDRLVNDGLRSFPRLGGLNASFWPTPTVALRPLRTGLPAPSWLVWDVPLVSCFGTG